MSARRVCKGSRHALHGSARSATMSQSEIEVRFRQVVDEIAEAATNAGRSPGDVALIAVTKTRSIAEVLEAVAAGALDLGENYVQEMVEKREDLAGRELPVQPRWHFIGHLQRNKVKYLPDFCNLIHSVDSVRLIEELDRRADQRQCKQAVLLQLDLAQEETKFGAPEEELPGLVEAMLAVEHLDWQGLMCMAPFSENAENARPYYARLREIREALSEQGVEPEHLRHLSMGMTSDYRVAIEEGSTLVRVGQAIFGPREYH